MSAGGKIVLVVVFNHRYEENIEKLERIYADRFQHRRYLVPFASGTHERTIRVFENGYTFSGHIAQGAGGYIQKDVDHYIFIADDLILNPSLNEQNLIGALGVRPEQGYIKSLCSADGVRYNWHSAVNATFSLIRPGFDFSGELPPREAAETKLRNMGFTFELSRPDLKNLTWAIRRAKTVPFWFARLLALHRTASTYPLLAGYADFCVVPGEAIADFVSYCGAFAAMDMFAEVAVPTALALAATDVKTELARGEHFAHPTGQLSPEITHRGLELWGEDVERFAESVAGDWGRLVSEFPPDRLYVHPVKLSKWTVS